MAPPIAQRWMVVRAALAHDCDDAQDATCADGNLITVGAQNAGTHDDPFTLFPGNGLGCSDHEFYNLAIVLHVGTPAPA